VLPENSGLPLPPLSRRTSFAGVTTLSNIPINETAELRAAPADRSIKLWRRALWLSAGAHKGCSYYLNEMTRPYELERLSRLK
jgi:hypothetical protein